MEHFTSQDWVDFVRNTVTAAREAEMRKHLERKCSGCLKTMQIWRFAMDETKALKRPEPPASSVQAAKDGFKLRKVVPFPSGKLELATLQFDSDRDAAVAGVRSGHASARQLLYRSGSVCIDMRMQPTPGTESIVIVGQLLDSMNPGHGIGGIPVSLLAHGDTLSRKRTNQDGEFDFGLEPIRDMQLVFGINEGRTIVVAVPEGKNRVV
jgi:hypothetical protein